MALEAILQPIMIGRREVKNRVVRTAHGTYLSTTRWIGGGDDLLAYHLARAKGGVGLSIFEAAEVHPSSTHGVALWDDRIIPEYQRIMKQMRPTGMRMLQQLWHAGHTTPGEGGTPPWGVSDLPGVFGIVPQKMTRDNIEELVAAYAKAAARCEEGGLDGVEFHCAHGYLPHQFLSQMVNDRDDEYGGMLENRMRFTQQCLRAIRAAVSDDFIVGVRMSASREPGSTSEAEMAATIQALEAEGLVDYLNASWGDYYRLETLIGSMHQPVGYGIPSSRQITAAAVKVPRIVVGRFRTLEEANQVIREGVADMVSMVRAHIADPDLVRKTVEGRVEDVRPCIACNQGCQGGIWRDGRLGCAVNAAAGWEATIAEDMIDKVESPRQILVVGGGPGGMEAARVAALRGHHVILAEASPDLGGLLNVAKRTPHAHQIGDIAIWLEEQVYKLGVDVRLNTYLDAADIRELGVDFVILATGSYPRMDGVQLAHPSQPASGIDQLHVLSSVDLIMGRHGDLGKTALVLDTVGHFEGPAVAEHLVSKGLAVTFVTHHNSFGGDYIRTTLRDVPLLEELYKGEFELLTRHMLVSIGQGTADIRPLQSSRLRTVMADTVVLITHNRSLNELHGELAKGNIPVELVGDARAPRDFQAAIKEGHRIARAIT